MKKGILIIAVGHENYLSMAINLAASIRVNDPDLPIALATDRSPEETAAMMPKLKRNDIFDSYHTMYDVHVQVIEDQITHKKLPALIKAKLHALDLTPFDETIFLDADQIMIKGQSLLPVFDELKDLDFTISNTGVAESSVWADIKEVKDLYGSGPYWNYHSEFMYFKKKSKAAKLYFKTALKIFSDNKIKSAKSFGLAPMADELALQAASLVTNIYPHKENWLPNFWFDRETRRSRLYPYQLTEHGFLTYSIGGKQIPQAIKTNYNNLANHYFAILNLLNPYQATDKSSFVPGRKNL